jgi:hypothetical protein
LQLVRILQGKVRGRKQQLTWRNFRT